MDTYFNVRLDDGTLVIVFADSAAEAVALAQAAVAPKRKRKPQK